MFLCLLGEQRELHCALLSDPHYVLHLFWLGAARSANSYLAVCHGCILHPSIQSMHFIRTLTIYWDLSPDCRGAGECAASHLPHGELGDKSFSCLLGGREALGLCYTHACGKCGPACGRARMDRHAGVLKLTHVTWQLRNASPVLPPLCFV